jgi:hypothetical protein
MIIDSTYFTGKLNLPQTGNTDGLNEVNQFIEIYEPEYLKKALGYSLWKAFTAGIAGSGPVEQRWLDLLEGKEFTYGNALCNWPGFAPLTEGGSYSINADNVEELTAGGAGTYDPVAGSAVMTLPPEFIPWDSTYAIYIRGTGRLKTTEYSVIDDQLTLLDGLQFNSGTVVFLEKGPRLLIVSGALLKQSPIANYIYFRFVENKASDTTLIGTVVSETDNNRTVSPYYKLTDAWNKMCDINNTLWLFLYANKDDYPEWQEYGTTGVIGWVNPFGYDRSEIFHKIGMQL